MRITLLTVIFSILCISSTSGNPDSLYYKSGARGYELVLDMRYEEANEIFDEMIRMEPDNAVGYIYKSQSFFHHWQYTYSNPDKKTLKQFKSLLFKAKDIALNMPDKDDIETLFIMGSAYGNIGLYYANRNNWFRAWWNGRKGIRYVEMVINKDPEYYNAYYLLGMYNYYAATLPKAIKSLSFLLGGTEGDREKGIEQLVLASSKSDLKGDAKIFLADSVYFYEKNYQSAYILLKQLEDEYPNNQYLNLVRAVCLRHFHRYDLSVRKLKSSLQSDSIKKFPYLHGEMYYSLGLAYSAMNEYEKAIPAFKKAVEISEKLTGEIHEEYNIWSLYEIGNAYEMLGSREKANEYYFKIKDKNSPAYKRAQARIKNPLTPDRNRKHIK